MCDTPHVSARTVDVPHVQQRERPPFDGNRSLHGVLLGARRTTADAEAVDQRTEALDVLLGQVLQQAATLADALRAGGPMTGAPAR